MRRCGNGENFKRTQKERKVKAPKELPRERPRALTSPPDPSSHRPSWNPFKKSIQQRTLDQSQSALFGQLPSEIRRIIWTGFVSGHLLHIARARNRLLAIECAEETGNEKLTTGSERRFNTRHHGCWGLRSGHSTTPGFYLGSRDKCPSKPANLLPLLQTCRRIYTETISMLYENNIFDINHLDTIFYLQKTVLSKRLNQIRMLNLTWDFKYPTASSVYSPPPYGLTTWHEACDAVSNFAGLQELTLHLTGRDLLPFVGRWDLETGSHPLLEPLKRIKPAKRFDVYLNWLEKDCIEAVYGKGYSCRFLSEIEAELRNDDTMEM